MPGLRRRCWRSRTDVRANGVLDGVEMFDAGLFGFSPRDAEILDPQQRVFLECAWEALEDSGRVPDGNTVPVGVFAGTSLSTYAFHLYNNPALVGLVNDFQILISNDKDHLATRVSYKLNLQGPAVSIGTACSTSLVATCLAAQSLLDYQCDLALAGGVSIGLPMRRGYVYESGGISSPDGHCRAFDAAAMGTVGGNGCAVVVLKRMADAIADGDPIRAVIRGWGLNNDGSDKVGYTAPSVDGQANAIATALGMADVDPDTITMMEAHGTATPLGDPIEIAALTKAWRRAKGRQYCALGSLKSNMGHMDSAAGAAGLIKCVLALQQRQIPPSLHFGTPNPKLELATSPFFVNTSLLDWQPECGVRRAAVSSFGIGGTNAHMVLEEAPAPPAATPCIGVRSELLPLSARSTDALEQMSSRLAGTLEQQPGLDLADVAHTLQVGRSEFRFRRVLLAQHGDVAEAARRLRAKDARYLISGTADNDDEGVAFLLPGQGAQHPGMARGLYRDEPVFRETVDRCAGILEPLLGLDLRRLLHDDDAGAMLRQTQYTQAAVFTVSYAIARLWTHWGVKPVALLGHSVGEYTAACLASVFSLEDALWLMVERGRILAAMPRGGMLAVAIPEATLRDRFSDDLDIAAVNGPSCVLAGDETVLTEVRALLEREGEAVQRLQTSHAFHSRLMDGALGPMAEALTRVRLSPPQIPCMSNLTGRWLRADEAQNPAYWSRHVRGTVRFADGLAQLLRETRAQLLEVGPGTTLTTLARQHGARGAGRPVLSSCRHPLDSIDDRDQLLQTVGRLWIAGAQIDWNAVRGPQARRRVALPSYPFERQHYWIEAPSVAAMAEASMPSEITRLPVEDWLYTPRWLRQGSLPPPGSEAATEWVLIGGTVDQSKVLARGLAGLGQRVRVLQSAEEDVLPESGPLVLVSLHGLEGDAQPGFQRGLAVLQPLGRRADPSRVLFLTRRMFAVTRADAPVDVEAAGLLGPLIVAPQEYPQLRCQAIDFDPAALGLLLAGDGQALIAEALAEPSLPWLAYRGAQRWALSFEPAPLAPVPAGLSPVLDGCYIVTGGFGRIGLLIAEFLARRGARVVVLVGRSTPAADDARLARIRALQASGTQVLLCAADVGVPEQAERVVTLARDAGGRVDGVFHAAGLTGAAHFGDFGTLDAASARPHFSAKHRGAQALAMALCDDPPAFFCLMSTISTVLGGIGFAAYAAANAMLDALAAAGRHRGATRWLTIDWDGWGFDATNGEDTLVHADDGIDVLERILAAPDLDHVVVSVQALGPRLQTWVLGAAASTAATPMVEASAGHERPELSTEFVPPTAGRPALIAGIWRELLGLAQVGAHDNFFELGGHSLLAIQIISRLRQGLGCDIPVRLLFDHPTVASLDAALESTLGAELAELLDRIETMPDSEVEALLQAGDTS